MTAKNDKQFVKCKDSACGYFTSTDNFSQYNDVFCEKVNQEFKEIRQPLCDHLQKATLRVLQSPKKPGKGFFSCGQIESCGYFQWAEGSPTRKTVQNWDKKDKPKMQLDKGTMTDPTLQSSVKRSSAKQGPGKETKKVKKYTVPENRWLLKS